MTLLDGSPDQRQDSTVDDAPPPECTTAGALDQTFGAGGIATFPIGAASSIIRGPADTVLVGLEGLFPPATSSECTVIRLTSGGQLDPSFGAGGIARVRVGDAWCDPSDIAVQSDGSIVAAAMRYGAPGLPRRLLVRLTPDGNLDPSFGIAGVVLETESPSTGSNNTLGIDSQDRIVVGAIGPSTEGSSTGRTYLRRYTRDGVPDLTFGADAQATNPLPPGQDSPWDLVILPKDAIAIVSAFDASEVAVARYLDDGTPDHTFAGTGWVTYPGDAGSKYPGLAVDVGGETTVVSGTTVARLDVVGALDASFTPPAFGGASFTRVSVAPAGKLAAVGVQQGHLVVGRFDATGAVDSGFGNAGLATSTAVEDDADLLVQPDGKIIAVGTKVTSTSEVVVVSRFCP